MRFNLFLPLSRGDHGRTRRILRKIGRTWLYSPARRLIQAICMILFLVLFFYVCWPYGSSHYAEFMAAKEFIAAESFLALDPLLSISTALASRTLIWSLALGGIVLLIGVIFSRWFCGYICPFGTLIDLFDWAIGKRITQLNMKRNGWWAYLRYYILLGVIIAALFGVLLSGLFAAIPVLTRGMLFSLAPLQIGLLKGWYRVPPANIAYYISLALFLIALLFGLLRRRFWCSYVCPTGALFSIMSFFRVTERRVEPTCIGCSKCVGVCPFDAIRSDFTTRTANCAFCQTCGGVCPTGSIQFVGRWSAVEQKPEDKQMPKDVSISRRGFFAGTLVALATVAGMRTVFGAESGSLSATPPIRPPGSVPEKKFLQMCIRCGECIKVCPNNVLQPMGFEQRLEGIWTPLVAADWAGCDPSCNNCGQVCPTGAIRALKLEEKRAVRMGLAVVDERTCLPHARREACQVCVDECTATGYNAIEFIRVGVEMDAEGMPAEGTGYLAPVMLDDKCVGCGICQARCYGINVKEKHLLKEAAIKVMAGSGKEDRMMEGSYLALREEERRKRREEREQLLKKEGVSNDYLPDFLK